jgi:hypothetical protein
MRRQAPSSRALAWTGLISNYSVRKLTYSSDQFAALAGLEAEFGELNTSDKCIMGIWMGDIHSQLLWTQSLGHDFAKSASAPAPPDWLKTPSWSWASIFAGVGWNPRVFESRKTDHLCSVETEGVTDTNHTLHISGLPFRLLEPDLGTIRPGRSLHHVALPGFGLKCYYSLDAWYLRLLLSLVSSDEDACIRLMIETTVILPVLCLRSVNGSEDGLECLLISQDIVSERIVYRRVGVVSMISGSPIKGEPSSHFTVLLKTQAENLDEADFVRRNDDGTFLIELV